MSRKSELLKWMESMAPVAEVLRAKEKPEIPDLTEQFLRPSVETVAKNKGNELLMSNVLNPLLDIICLYKETDDYNHEPGAGEDSDGWDYFQKRFYDLYRGLEQNLYISHDKYLAVHKVIDEVKAFVCSFEGADGLPERYFEINPNLRFYRTAFDLWEEDKQAYGFAVSNNLLAYVPTGQDFKEQEAYFEAKEQYSKGYNFQYNKDDFFMMELAHTLRMVFLQDLEMCKA